MNNLKVKIITKSKLEEFKKGKCCHDIIKNYINIIKTFSSANYIIMDVTTFSSFDVCGFIKNIDKIFDPMKSAYAGTLDDTEIKVYVDINQESEQLLLGCKEETSCLPGIYYDPA